MPKKQFILVVTFSLIITLSLFFLCCTSKDDENLIITEPVGSSEYFIKNDSNINLRIVFTKSEELGFEIDSSKTIRRKSVEMIFSDGSIGSNPKPTNSFSKMEFYNVENNADPIIIISPILDNDWNIIEQEIGDNGLGHTKYELVFPN